MQVSNTFLGGIDSDTEFRKMSNKHMRDAENIDLMENGVFGEIVNMKGTTRIDELLTSINVSTTNALATISTTGKVNGIDVPGILLFIKEGDNSHIKFHDINAGITTNLITTDDTAVNPLNFPPEGTIGHFEVKYLEANRVVFVDDANDLRFIQVEVPFTQTVIQMLLRPPNPGDRLVISANATPSNGSLISGEYQFVYRGYDSVLRRFSAWSPPTNPVPVTPGDPISDPDNALGGKVGEITNKNVAVNIIETAGATFLAAFDMVQLGVIKKILSIRVTDPTTGEPTSVTSGAILSPVTKNFVGGQHFFSYTGNEAETAVNISEFLTEDAPIMSFKDIEQKDNLAFGLGPVFNDLLDFDNGDPVFTKAFNTLRILTGTGKAYKNPIQVVSDTGYFHDELYRFGIVYFDRFSNTSPPFIFDFSAFARLNHDTSRANLTLTGAPTSGTVDALADTIAFTTPGNATALLKDYDLLEFLDAGGSPITGAQKQVVPGSVVFTGPDTDFVVSGSPLTAAATSFRFLYGDDGNFSSSTDWKFPPRSSAKFTILDKLNLVNALGLKIEGIKNHPSWAVGYAIVRADRKSNIVYQGIQVPCAAYKGTTAGEESFVGPKVFNLGSARNLVTIDVLVGAVTIKTSLWRIQDAVAGVGDEEKRICSLLYMQPGAYMANNAGVAFDSEDAATGLTARIVDGVLLKRIRKNVTGASNNGGLANNANIYAATSFGKYFYNRDAISQEVTFPGPIVVKRFFEKIHTLPGVLATETFKINTVREVEEGHSAFTLADNGFSGNTTLESASKFGNGTALSVEEGTDPALASTEAALFGEPVENQRAQLYFLDNGLEDFTFQVATNLHASTSRDFFTNSTDKISKDTIGDAYIVDGAGAPSLNFYADENNSRAIGALFVINVERGRGDGRYGAVDNKAPYRFTGIFRALNPADISGNTAFNETVFGGDCLITRMAMKVSNSTVKTIGLSAGNSKAGTYEDNVSIIDVFVESTVNLGMLSQSGIYPQNSASTSLGTYNVPYTYAYHFDYSAQNNDKKMFTADFSLANITDFPAVVQWSDKNIPLTQVFGFDRWRAANNFPLEAQFGDGTAIVKSKDAEMYVLQERGIRYLLIGKATAELQDGTTMVFGTGDVISNTISYVTTQNGCQHMRSVIVTKEGIYFFDGQKREVRLFPGRTDYIDIGVEGLYTLIKAAFTDTLIIPEHQIDSYYDFNKKEYWIVSRGTQNVDHFAAIYTNLEFQGRPLNVWKTRLTPKCFQIVGGVFAHQEFYLLGMSYNYIRNGGFTSQLFWVFSATSKWSITIGTGLILTGVTATIPERTVTQNFIRDFPVGKTMKITWTINQITGGKTLEVRTLPDDLLVDSRSAAGTFTNTLSSHTNPITGIIIKELTGLVDGIDTVIQSIALAVDGEDNLLLDSAWTNSRRGLIFNEFVDSTFEMVVNQPEGQDKAFRMVVLVAIHKMESAVFTVTKGTNTTTVATVDLTTIEAKQGKYYITKLRDDVEKSRLRGIYMLCRFVMVNTLIGIEKSRKREISSIITEISESHANFKRLNR